MRDRQHTAHQLLLPTNSRNCHPERSEGPAFALVFLSVIPEGNLLFSNTAPDRIQIAERTKVSQGFSLGITTA